VKFLAEAGTIDDADLDLFRYAETAEEAWRMIQQFYRRRPAAARHVPGSDAWIAD
jgi:predicted Rossmann-fold nucleotide-binding protein